MFYEVTIKTTRTDDKGREKEFKETYLTDVELFSEAEMKGLEQEEGCDVIAIKRSNIIEIVNERDIDDVVYKATISDIYTDDKGNEKENKYRVIVYAPNIALANKKMEDYLKQGIDMNLLGINKSNIIEVI